MHYTKTILTFLLNLSVLSLWNNPSAIANHYRGSQISYRNIDSLVFEVSFDIFRDCDGDSISGSSFKFTVTDYSGNKHISLSPTIQYYKNITLVCDTVTSPCNPPNTPNTGYGTEKIRFTDTVDLKNSKFAGFNLKRKVFFELAGCCRSGSTDNIDGNTSVYNFAMLDLGKVTSNSSPTFFLDPNSNVPLNESRWEYFGIQDRAEEDSVSFKIARAYSSPTSAVKYYRPYPKPFKVYDPGNLGITNPKANPPIGFYFDEEYGGMIFISTAEEEILVTYDVFEWRKDTNGSYKNIGTTRREIVYSVTKGPANHAPQINGPFSYAVCDGDNLSFKITTDDKTYVPPPPAPNPAPDTISLDYVRLPQGATMSISKSRTPSGTFSWTPKLGNLKPKAFYFTVYGDDNHCPRSSSVSQTFRILVNPRRPDSLFNIHEKVLSCGRYALSFSVSDSILPSRVRWTILDSNGSILRYSSLAKFASSNSFQSFAYADTVQINRSGKMKIRLDVWYNNSSCSSTAISPIEQTYVKYDLIRPTDSLICANSQFDLSLDTVFSKVLNNIVWQDENNILKTDSFVSFNDSTVTTIYVSGEDGLGCLQSDSIRLSSGRPPTIQSIPNDTFCPTEFRTFEIHKLVHKGYLPTAISWDEGITDTVRTIDSTGNYFITAKNECGYDSVSFQMFVTNMKDRSPHIDRIPPDTLCLPFGIKADLNDLIQNQGPEYSYHWSDNIDSSVRIFTDSTNVKLKVQNICGADSTTIVFFADTTPTLEPILSQKLCREDSVSIDAKVNSARLLYPVTYQWSTGDTSNEIRPTGSGFYSLVCQNKCGMDSISFTLEISQAPHIQLPGDTSPSEPFSIELKADTVSAKYRWNTGDTTHSITVSEYGVYTVTVENHCGFDLGIIEILPSLSVENSDKPQTIAYPNPNNGTFTISANTSSVEKIEIWDVTGIEVIFHTEIDGKSTKVILNNQKPGEYLVLIEAAGRTSLLRITVI